MASIIERAVIIAQKRGQAKQWKPGDTACHPKEPTTCSVLTYPENGLVTIGFQDDNQKIEWTVPVEEIFDPNTARIAALNLKFGFPEENDGMALDLIQ